MRPLTGMIAAIHGGTAAALQSTISWAAGSNTVLNDAMISGGSAFASSFVTDEFMRSVPELIATPATAGAVGYAMRGQMEGRLIGGAAAGAAVGMLVAAPFELTRAAMEFGEHTSGFHN